MDFISYYINFYDVKDVLESFHSQSLTTALA